MAGSLYDIVKWMETNGEVKSIDRLRVALLPDFLSEDVLLASLSPETACSPGLLAKVKAQAGDIVGQPCPV